MKRPTALGCYIFAGGFTVGVSKYFDVLAHFEEGPYGTETAAHNLPFLRDRIFTDHNAWPVDDYAGRVDFVYGNPPCAPWSVCSAGRAVPWRLDPRVACTNRLYSLVERMRPKVWAFESVRPTFNKGRELVDEMVMKAADAGYGATALMVESTRHGVPQRRPRFFLVLSKFEIDWEPTHQKRVVTVGDAFAKPFKSFTCTKEGSKFFLDLVHKTKHGQRVAALFNKLYPERVAEGERTGEWVKGRPSFQNIRLDPNEPSCTLTGGAKQIHPDHDRFISIEESAVLCGFPRNFKFLGSIGMQYKQVAQGVMPPVGEYLAKSVAAALESKVKIRKPGFERVEIFSDRVERVPLGTQQQLPFDPDPKTVVSLPPRDVKQKEMKVNIDKRVLSAVETIVKFFDGRITWPDAAPVEIDSTPTRRRRAAAIVEPDDDESEAAPAKPVRKARKPVPVERPAPVAAKTASRPSPAGKANGKAPPPSDEPVKRGSGARIRELLQKGWDTERILATIHNEFPGSKAKASDVSWNKRKLQQMKGEA